MNDGPDIQALASIGWQGARPAYPVARVVAQHRASYDVHDGHEISTAQPAMDFLKPGLKPEQRPAVGDFVRIEPGATTRIVEILPRRTALVRAAAGERYRRQLIATNVDTVLVLTGLDGDFNPQRIERYLSLTEGSGAQAVVVLTKADRCSDVQQRIDTLQARLAEGVPVRAINARDAASTSALAAWLGAGQTVVLVGSSGAGKSTLTNTLLGESRMQTGAVRSRDSRGRHTTTHRALLKLPGGACLIDTPGMRELKLTGEESLDQFADIEALAQHCRFSDCAHQREPGCAVRAAIEQGELEPRRLDNYRKLAEERRQQQALGRHSGRDRRSAGGRRLPPAPGDAE